MRQILLAFISTAFALACYCQSQQATNEIIAEGSAKMKVKPDIVVFTLTMEKRDSSEKRAITNLNIAIDALEKALNKIGFSNNAIKILDYDVSSAMNEQGNKKTYTATNVLNLEFQIENKLISAIYNQIQQANIQDLNIEFETRLSDSLERISRKKLVQISIEDARTNAVNIATALNIKLGTVKQVQKSATGPVLFKREMEKFTPPKIAGEEPDIRYKTSFDKFEINELELEEQITIIYTIAN
ncbi:MAG: SIMPL domain-containing protein [Flavisolibacter sp.]